MDSQENITEKIQGKLEDFFEKKLCGNTDILKISGKN